MLKERQYIFSRVNALADAALIACSVAIAHWLRDNIIAPYVFPRLLRGISPIEDSLWLLLAAPLITIYFLSKQGYYDAVLWKARKPLFGKVVLSVFKATVALVVIAFFLQSNSGSSVSQNALLSPEKTSRSVILIFPVIAALIIGAKTALVQAILEKWRDLTRSKQAVVLVGSGESLRKFIRVIHSHPWWGLSILGIVDDTGREAKAVEGVRVIGSLKTLIPFIERTPVDEVIFLPESVALAQLTPYFEQCEEMGVRTRLSLNFFRPSIARPVLDAIDDIPIVSYFPTREMNAALMFKYAFDRVAALVLLILLSPVFLITAILIKLTSESWRDPIFYGQTRCGLNGKPFTCWKFRSMKVGAEKELDKLREKNVMGGPVFKMKDDPRITPIGRFLRKTSIDELPQLWNVLKGEMSLVGPRPPIPAEVEKYDRWQRRRLSMKPGITCLWQVSGRNKLPFDVWMKLDLDYIDNWSLWLDFKILLKTIYVVATGYGAM
ncbi:MAG: sugar transferase [Candidatus Sumerlaeaceae bacterium]|nr:sugar transferase [Candidatus Sumerlaeaceae bacterium]